MGRIRKALVRTRCHTGSRISRRQQAIRYMKRSLLAVFPIDVAEQLQVVVSDVQALLI